MGEAVEPGRGALAALFGLRRRRRGEARERAAGGQQAAEEDLSGEEDGGRVGVLRGEELCFVSRLFFFLEFFEIFCRGRKK